MPNDRGGLPLLSAARNPGRDGLHVRVRPLTPKRWWRPDGVLAWLVELRSTGAILQMKRFPEAKSGSRWVMRVGILEGHFDIGNVSTVEIGLQGITVDVRFVRLDAQLQQLVDGYLEGSRTATDWHRFASGDR
jgi:hypothetical protein